jgi:WD40 repeat protein/serine/threonine protein kinase
MRIASPCPKADVLRQFLLGDFPDSQANSLEQHLLACGPCAEALKALAADDVLARPLQNASGLLQAPACAVVDSLMERLFEFQQPLATLTGDGTPLPAAAGAGVATYREACALLAPPVLPDEIGRLGGYRVLKVLGAGGMGVVFQAEDLQLRRPVAVKVLKPALGASAEARERFQREAQAAAGLEHDHIVTIYHEGEDRGVPFLVMQLLHGESLDDRLGREGRLSVAEVVRIGREIAAGLAAAHARGLIHRDIKPANIWLESLPQPEGRGQKSEVRSQRSEVRNELLTSDLRPLTSGEGGRVKILDFGLVRVLEADVALTQAGTVTGTPHYMAPEQAGDGPVDARADLFSLGCVLYRMATGQVPFPGRHTLAVLRSLELKQPQSPRELNPQVPPALAGLILQLLAKKPADRPASAAAVAAALAAIPPAALVAGRGPKGKRRRWPVWAAGILLALGFAGDRPVPGPGDSVIGGVGRSAPSATRKPRGWCPADDLRRDQIPPYELAIAGGGDPKRAPAELVAILGDSRLIHQFWVGLVAFSPDGKSLVTLNNDHVAILWDLATGRQRWTFPIDLGKQQGWQWAAFSPNGRTLAVTRAAGVTLLDTATGRPVGKVAPGTAVSAVAFSPNGKWLAWASAAGPITLWDRPGREARRTLPAKATTTFLRFLPNSRTLVAGNHPAQTITRWDTATGRPRHPVRLKTEDPGVFAVAMTPDGRTFSGAYENAGLVKLWSAGTGEVRRVLGRLASSKARSVAFSPDGRLLAAGGWQGDLRIWDVKTGQEVHQLRGHWTSVLTLDFSPDGRTLASGDDHGIVKLWDVKTGRLQVPAGGHRGSINSVTVSPDGRTMASASADGTVKIWELSTGRERRSLAGHQGAAGGLAYSPNGRTLASSGWDARVRLWDPATGWLQNALKSNDFWVNGVAWHPNKATLASAHADGCVRLWDSATGKLLNTWPGHQAVVQRVAFSPDGRLLASADEAEQVILRDAETGRILHKLQGQLALAFHPGGQTLATSAGGQVFLWDVVTGTRYRTLSAPSSALLTGAAFGPGGRTLVAGDTGGTVYLWDVKAGGRPRRRIQLTPGVGISQVTFTPEGRHLVTGHYNGTICVLRLAPRRPEGRRQKAESRRQKAEGNR